MTAVEVLSPTQLVVSPSSFKEHTLRDRINAVTHSRARTLSLSYAPGTAPVPEELHLFDNLPPLLSGRTDTHLRQGVISASHRSALGEPDAERAFFVADLSAVLSQHQRWNRALPEIEPFYAVKCNPDPYVLRLLAALGTGFDCASNGEISQVLELGVDPSRIIFANPCKPTSFVRAAQRSGVEMMTFDNADELHKVARVYPRAKLVLRILTDDSAALCQLGLKFGAPLAAVPGLIALAKQLKLDVIGVSFHVGSGSQDPHAFADAVQRARVAFDAGLAAGYDFKLLDIGGGFDHSPDFEVRAAVLREALAVHFPERRVKGIRVIAEPGRFYVASAFSLAACVIARRGRVPSPDEVQHGHVTPPVEKDQPKVMYYINDGVYGAFNCILFDHYSPTGHVLSMGGSFHVPTSAPTTAASIWGPTCDSIDCVAPATTLPTALSVGDWLWFGDMGAYTRCAASRFNGFEVSGVVYTAGVGSLAKEVRRVLDSEAKREKERARMMSL